MPRPPRRPRRSRAGASAERSGLRHGGGPFALEVLQTTQELQILSVSMPRAKRSIEGGVTIDGVPLIWRLHREEQGSTEDGWRGISIHVSVANGVRRELFLEYPAVTTQRAGSIRTQPARPTVTGAKVAGHIREAISAGWDPESRGKPFVFEVSETPS
jgi:hypothetical protein